jgi:hypothetical protein
MMSAFGKKTNKKTNKKSLYHNGGQGEENG